jgi:hypothetical protein
MHDDTIDDQNELLRLLEDAGWSVSKVETREREYEQPNGQQVRDVAVELTITTKYYEDGFENPYQIK